MEIIYIGHSGFLVKTAGCAYLFDYCKGELPSLPPDLPVIVFCSHGHADHFQPGIFSLLKEAGSKTVFAVLAKDIPIKKYPREVETLRVYANHTYSLPQGGKLETLLSTDSGVAFILTTEKGVIYHAGDLNDWGWKEESPATNRRMRGNYRHEIQKLRGRHINAAFLPLDPRQEEYYAAGITYFLEQVHPDAVFPMHYWDKPWIIQNFLQEYPQYQDIIKNTEDYRIDPAPEPFR